MNNPTKNLMPLALALLLSVPAISLVQISDAEAQRRSVKSVDGDEDEDEDEESPRRGARESREIRETRESRNRRSSSSSSSNSDRQTEQRDSRPAPAPTRQAPDNRSNSNSDRQTEQRDSRPAPAPTRRATENRSNSNSDRQTEQRDSRPAPPAPPATRPDNTPPPVGEPAPSGRYHDDRHHDTHRTTTRDRRTTTRDHYQESHTDHRSNHSSSHNTYTEHHHYYDNDGPAQQPAPSSFCQATYVTLGAGMGSLRAQGLIDTSASATELNLGLGLRGKLFGAEFGINGGGYNYDPDFIGLDAWTIGLSADLRIQPSFGIIEPFAMIGVGGYGIVDTFNDEGGVGASLRLGAGADFRINDFALSARYLHSRYAFDTAGPLNDTASPLNGSSTSNSVGLNFSFYF